LLKFKLLEWQQIAESELLQWVSQTPYCQTLHQQLGPDQSLQDWALTVVQDLVRTGAAQCQTRDSVPWVLNA
jgi:hypothetical protein